MRLKLWLVTCAGLAAGSAAVWLAAHQHFDRPTEPGAVLTLVVGASLLASGLGSWRVRPENRLGPVMVLTGFAWFAGQLSESGSPVLYTIGALVQYVFIIGFFYMLLSFPSGRLEHKLDRVLIGSVSGIVFGLQLLAMLIGNHSGVRCPACPDNVLHVVTLNHVARGLLTLLRVLGGIGTLVTIVVLVRRWMRASPPQRRAVAPVLWTGCVTLAGLILTVVDDLVGDPLGALPIEVVFYAFATVPVAVLFVSLQRTLARGMVAGLVVELGTPSASGDLRQALARALGDRSLELAFWFPAESRYVGADGRPVELPEPGGTRRSTFVERDGQPIAMLLHDPALEHNAELVQSVCAAAGLALENERLHAELRARLVELQASRARLVGATDSERRRIERDLHDGTQQRLVSIAMSLGLLDSKLPGDPSAARPIVQETREALAVVLQELRELTHGIRPPLLVERGLPAALDELCRRAALPGRVSLAISGRLPEQVESAAYFFASEALTNAAKHSHASEVFVAARVDGGTLMVEVADDGIGGAATGGGSGLRGLADRVEALGGRFTLSSPPGRGTTLRAEIPCG